MARDHGKDDERTARLAAKLRENLRRRKVQARAIGGENPGKDESGEALSKPASSG